MIQRLNTVRFKVRLKPKTRERKDVQYIEQTSGDLTPWEEKKEIGYFRGRDSNPGRLTLCEMSMNHPEDVDARYVTHICVTKIFEEIFGCHLNYYFCIF